MTWKCNHLISYEDIPSVKNVKTVKLSNFFCEHVGGLSFEYLMKSERKMTVLQSIENGSSFTYRSRNTTVYILFFYTLGLNFMKGPFSKWKFSHPFWVEPPNIVHCREYLLGFLERDFQIQCFYQFRVWMCVGEYYYLANWKIMGIICTTTNAVKTIIPQKQ